MLLASEAVVLDDRSLLAVRWVGLGLLKGLEAASNNILHVEGGNEVGAGYVAFLTPLCQDLQRILEQTHKRLRSCVLYLFALVECNLQER